MGGKRLVVVVKEGREEGWGRTVAMLWEAVVQERTVVGSEWVRGSGYMESVIDWFGDCKLYRRRMV